MSEAGKGRPPPHFERGAEVVGPHPVDQSIDWDGTVHVDQQGGKHAPLPGMADFEPPAVKSSLDVTE